MSFAQSPSSLDYTANTGLSAHSSGPALYSGVPSSTTLNGPNGPFKLGNLILNTLTGTLYYLASITTSGGVTSATWNVIESSSAGVLSVSEGGTGDSTLTAHGVLIGEGTSPVNVTTAGTLGQPLVSGGASADPAFALLGVVGGGTGAATLTGLALGNGTSAFTGVTYTASTVWTPTLAFGGSSTGITYTTHTGYYQQVGNMVFYSFLIKLSSKGAQTGAATIGGFPVATGANGVVNSVGSVYIDGVTLDASYTQLGLLFNNASTSVSLIEMGSGEAAQVATNAMFANTSAISMNGVYFIT